MTDQALSVARAAVDRSPSEPQKAAGNYRKGHIWVQGMDITIENPKGSVRRGVDGKGRQWSCVLPTDYGYIRGTEGADGDHVDVYLGPDRSSPVVFLINQMDHRSGRFDEHKAMVAYRHEREALKDYCVAFSDGKGHQRVGSIEVMSVDAFKHWLKNGQTHKIAKAGAIIDQALRSLRLRKPVLTSR